MLIEKAPQYLFFLNEIWINSNESIATEIIKDHPELPVVNQRAFELFAELIKSDKTKEEKLWLIEQAIKALSS